MLRMFDMYLFETSPPAPGAVHHHELADARKVAGPMNALLDPFVYSPRVCHGSAGMPISPAISGFKKLRTVLPLRFG